MKQRGKPWRKMTEEEKIERTKKDIDRWNNDEDYRKQEEEKIARAMDAEYRRAEWMERLQPLITILVSAITTVVTMILFNLWRLR